MGVHVCNQVIVSILIFIPPIYRYIQYIYICMYVWWFFFFLQRHVDLLHPLTVEYCQAAQFFYSSGFKTQRSCRTLTKTWSESSLSVEGQGRVSRRRAELFVWLFRILENKHSNGTLIKDRNVAFYFQCPRTYNSTDDDYMAALKFLIT